MHKLPNKLRPIVVIDGTNMETEFQTQKVFYSVFALLIDQMLIIKGNVDRVPWEDEWNHVVVSINVDFKWNPT